MNRIEVTYFSEVSSKSAFLWSYFFHILTSKVSSNLSRICFLWVSSHISSLRLDFAHASGPARRSFVNFIYQSHSLQRFQYLFPEADRFWCQSEYKTWHHYLSFEVDWWQEWGPTEEKVIKQKLINTLKACANLRSSAGQETILDLTPSPILLPSPFMTLYN